MRSARLYSTAQHGDPTVETRVTGSSGAFAGTRRRAHLCLGKVLQAPDVIPGVHEPP